MGGGGGGGAGPEDRSIFIPACHKRVRVSCMLSGRRTVSSSRCVKPSSSAPEADTRAFNTWPNFKHKKKAVIFDEV